MLVCNVSLRPRRTAISAAIIEAATATDGATTGNIVFATLVDDPASVLDIVDAYLGEIMVEAASASDTSSVGIEYSAGADEALTAVDTADATVIGAAIAREAMVQGAMINTTTSRQAYVDSVMINQ